MLYLFCKTVSKVRFLITTLWISLEKGECLISITLEGVSLFLYSTFQVADLLSLFINIINLDNNFDEDDPDIVTLIRP